MKKFLVPVAVTALASSIILTGNTATIHAATVKGEVSLGGFSYFLDNYYDTIQEEAKNFDTTSLLADPIVIPENIAIVNVKDFLNVREGAGKEYNIIAYMPKNSYCIVEEIKDGWAKIKSGGVTGYVSSEYLLMGEEGQKKAKEVTQLLATVKANAVNLRSEPDTESEDTILAEVNMGEVLVVTEENVITKDDQASIWVKVKVDSLGVEGYVAKQFVDVAYDWVKAVPMSSIATDSSGVGISILRNALVTEGKKYLGLKYVWGGNSLTTGADCSGYILAVYRACGIDTSELPRASYDIIRSSKGRTVSYDEAKPGDLVFYGNSTGSVINHVAMYIGNGQIIHESGYAYGCRISDINYRKVIKIKNFLD